MPSDSVLERMSIVLEADISKWMKGTKDAGKGIDELAKKTERASQTIDQKFSRAMSNLDTLHAAGKLGAIQHARAVDQLTKAYEKASEAAAKSAKGSGGSVFGTAFDHAGLSVAALKVKAMMSAHQFGTDLGEHFGGRSSRHFDSEMAKGQHLENLAGMQQKGREHLQDQAIGGIDDPKERLAAMDKQIAAAQKKASDLKRVATDAKNRYEKKAGLDDEEVDTKGLGPVEAQRKKNEATNRKVLGFVKRQVGDKDLAIDEKNKDMASKKANEAEERNIELIQKKEAEEGRIKDRIDHTIKSMEHRLKVEEKARALGMAGGKGMHGLRMADQVEREGGNEQDQAKAAAIAEQMNSVQVNHAAENHLRTLRQQNFALSDMSKTAAQVAHETKLLALAEQGVSPKNIEETRKEFEKTEALNLARKTEEHTKAINRHNQAYGDLALSAKQAAIEAERLQMIEDKVSGSQIEERIAAMKKKAAIDQARSVQDAIEGIHAETAALKDQGDVLAKHHKLLKDATVQQKEQVRQAELQKKGQELINKYKTPREKYDEEIKNLNAIFEASDKGAAAQRAFSRAAQDAKTNLEGQHKVTQDATLAGSGEAMAKIQEAIYKRQSQQTILPNSMMASNAQDAARAKTDARSQRLLANAGRGKDFGSGSVYTGGASDRVKAMVASAKNDVNIHSETKPEIKEMVAIAKGINRLVQIEEDKASRKGETIQVADANL